MSKSNGENICVHACLPSVPNTQDGQSHSSLFMCTISLTKSVLAIQPTQMMKGFEAFIRVGMLCVRHKTLLVCVDIRGLWLCALVGWAAPSLFMICLADAIYTSVLTHYAPVILSASGNMSMWGPCLYFLNAFKGLCAAALVMKEGRDTLLTINDIRNNLSHDCPIFIPVWNECIGIKHAPLNKHMVRNVK